MQPRSYEGVFLTMVIEKIYERFCVNCGVWFDDDKIVCPNCNHVKILSAMTRNKATDLGMLIEKAIDAWTEDVLEEKKE